MINQLVLPIKHQFWVHVIHDSWDSDDENTVESDDLPPEQAELYYKKYIRESRSPSVFAKAPKNAESKFKRYQAIPITEPNAVYQDVVTKLSFKRKNNFHIIQWSDQNALTIEWYLELNAANVHYKPLASQIEMPTIDLIVMLERNIKQIPMMNDYRMRISKYATLT